jgi:hypothetical protein
MYSHRSELQLGWERLTWCTSLKDLIETAMRMEDYLYPEQRERLRQKVLTWDESTDEPRLRRDWMYILYGPKRRTAPRPVARVAVAVAAPRAVAVAAAPAVAVAAPRTAPPAVAVTQHDFRSSKDFPPLK